MSLPGGGKGCLASLMFPLRALDVILMLLELTRHGIRVCTCAPGRPIPASQAGEGDQKYKTVLGELNNCMAIM